MALYAKVGGRIRRWLAEGARPKTGPLCVPFAAGFALILFGVGSLAAEPVITGVTIPNVTMKINDVVTAMISVQSDSATVYTLNASNIGGHALGSLSKQDSTTYTATFMVTEGGTDYAAGADIPTSVTLANSGLTDTWDTAISQANDQIDANAPNAVSIVRRNPTSEYTNANTVTFRVTFDEDVQDVSIADFALSGPASGSINLVSMITADCVYDVAVTSVSGDGELDLDIANGNDIQDTVGNPLGNAPAIGTKETYAIDNTPPSVPDGLSPADDSYTTDTSPTLSWNQSTDAGGSGMRTTNTYRYFVTGTPSRDSYTANTTYTPNLAEGVFKWKIYARDNAGNNSDWSSEYTLTIDKTPPGVTIDQAGAQADPTNSSPVVFTVVFDESINVGTFTDADVNVAGTATTVAVAVNEVAPNDGTAFSISVVVTGDGTVTVMIPAGGVEDPAGHMNAASTSTDNSVTYDSTDPIDPIPSSSTHTVNIVSKDDTVDIEISGASDAGSTGVDGFDTAWDQNDIWAVTMVKDQEETWTGGTFTATANGDWYFHIATVDNAGNWTGSAHLGPFPIDTTAPQVSDVTVNDTIITDADTPGTATFEVTVDFDGSMDTGVDPTLVFNLSVGTTLTVNVGQSEWTDNDTYKAKYDVADGNVDHGSVTLDVTGAQDPAGNGQEDYTPEHEFEIDTLNPTGISVALSANVITDTDVDGTFAVTVNYSEPMLSGTSPSIVYSPNLDTTLSLQGGSSDWNDDDTYVASYTILDRNVTVLDDDITVFAGQDLVGNVQESYNYDDQLDVDTENPYIHDFAVTGGAVDDNCLRVVTFTAKVTDPNGTMVPGDVTVTDATVTNATIGAVYGILQTSDSQTTLTITGKVDVAALTSCLARVAITLDAVDSASNKAAQQSQFGDVVDTTIPVINDLVVADHELVSADCCETTVNFTANVIDNCCITPNGIAIAATNPTNNLTINFYQARDVTITQNGEGRVDISGVLPVRCMTGCPAIVQVTVNATDCCGNNAVSVTSAATEGRVYDETAPEPNDDPNGDEDRSTSDNLEVRSDDYEQHRLMVREDTPVRVDVVYNDDDNCSSCTCCGTMWIHDIVNPLGFGTATIEVDHGDCSGGSSIRYAPYRGYIGLDEFTYRIEDSCGNVSREATVYIEVVARTVMDDIYLTTCGGAALSKRCFRILIAPSTPGCGWVPLLPNPFRSTLRSPLGL